MDLEKGIVRVLGPDGATAGAGFLVRGSDAVLRILTCSHVLLDPIIQGKEAPRPERAAVAFLADAKDALPREATIESWVPYADGDIAVLRLEGDPPEEAEALPLGSAEHAPGQPFKTFGFPPDTPSGMVAKGAIRALVDSRIQLGEANEITPGFSGAPLLAESAGRVVGMVVSIRDLNRYGRGPETAFAIPVERIREACSKLEPDDVCPYRGLAAFTEEDARFFLGRSRTVDELERRLAVVPTPRLLAVFGPSGSGKSSLVRAGLVARLRGYNEETRPPGPRWSALVTRPSDALGDTPAEPGGNRIRGPRGLTLAWQQSRGEDERLLLVVDQLEELFTTGSHDARDMYIRDLTAIVDDQTADATVLLVMRSDFTGRLDDEGSALQSRLAPEGRYHVPLTLDEATLHAMIVEPAERVGLGLGEGLAEDITKDTIEEAPDPTDPTVAKSSVLPLLGDALYELWRRRHEGELTRDAYRAIGGVAGTLPGRASKVYRGLSAERQALARRILISLVHFGDAEAGSPDTRWRRSRADLPQGPDGTEAVDGLLLLLAGERLVVTSGDDSGASVELMHESLILRWRDLAKWIEEDREFRLWLRRVQLRRKEWEASHRDDGALLGGPPLDVAADWLKRRELDLGPPVTDYIERSLARRLQELQDREAQLQRELAMERKAKEEAERALSAQLEAAVAKARLDHDVSVKADVRTLVAMGGAILFFIFLIIMVVQRLGP